MAELTKNLRSAYQKGYTLGAQLRLRAVKARGPSLADKAGRSSLRREFNWAFLETGDLIQSKHLKDDDQNRESARASQHQDHISIGSEQFHRHVFSFSISPQRFPRHSPNFSQLIQKVRVRQIEPLSPTATNVGGTSVPINYKGVR